MASHDQPDDLNHKLPTAYYFNHIPKTAGTSFIVILDRFFHQQDIFKPQLWWEVGTVAAVKAKPYACFRGHFGMGGQVLSQQPMRKMTILRDPVALSHSTYQYIKREQQTALHQYVVDQDMSFEDFLTDPKTRNLAANRLLKSLSFALDLDASSCPDDLSIDDINYRKFRKFWNQSRKTMPDADHLKLVQTYLSDFFWIGLQEHLDQALLLLCHQMAWPPIGPTTRLNSFAKQQHISDRAIELVQQLNSVDSQLYDWARTRFELQWQQFCDDAGLDPKDTASIERYVDRHYQQQHVQQLTQELSAGIRYEFDQPLLGQNWHRRESVSQTERSFRWTGPEKTSQIDLWLQPHAYQVKIRYINVSAKDLFKDLNIAVNDHAVDWSHQSTGSGGVIQFNTEKGMTKDHGLFRLTMVTAELKTHAEVFASTDNRKVGLAIEQIEVVAI